MYKKEINPSEEEVNKLLKNGYSLFSITPVYKPGNSYIIGKTDLVYHFIKIELALPYDMNFNEFNESDLLNPNQ